MNMILGCNNIDDKYNETGIENEKLKYKIKK